MSEKRASFNIIEQPWIFVVMQNGEKRFVNLREIYENSRNIKTVVPPVFFFFSYTLYMPVLYKFLSVVVMSAYFKTGEYGNGNLNYIDDFWYSDKLLDDTLFEYLEKYYERFDIFSEKYPFLQNGKLAEYFELSKFNPDKSGSGYITLLNPVAPSKNAVPFGFVRTIGENGSSTEYMEEAWRPTPLEFLYELLYNSSDAFSVMPGQYTSAIGGKTSIYPILTGKDVHETILLNCVGLDNSIRISRFNKNVVPDAPIWERETSPSAGCSR